MTRQRKDWRLYGLDLRSMVNIFSQQVLIGQKEILTEQYRIPLQTAINTFKWIQHKHHLVGCVGSFFRVIPLCIVFYFVCFALTLITSVCLWYLFHKMKNDSDFLKSWFLAAYFLCLRHFQLFIFSDHKPIFRREPIKNIQQCKLGYTQY